MSEYEARQALQSIFDHYELRQEVRRGLLGDSNGNVEVSGRPGWAYIRYRQDLNRLMTVRYLLQEQLPDDCPVVVGKKHPADPFEQVLGVDWAMYAWSPASGTVTEWATPAITLNDLAPGKVVPTNPASLSVDVRGFLYVNGATAVEYGGGQIDMTGSVPGVAGHRLTLVYMDLDTDGLALEDGTIVAVGTDAVAPTVPENSVPLAVVDLANGDTTIPAGAIYQYKVLYDSVGGEIPLSMLADYARGYIIRGGAADWEAYDAATDGAALYGDGTDILSSLTPTWKGTHTWTPGDDQGIILNLDAAQSVDIFQVKNSGGNVVSGYDERGIPFADGNTDASNYFAGADAGRIGATGTDDTAVGHQAGDALTSGELVTAFGKGAASAVADGSYYTAIGAYALHRTVSTDENVAVGDYAIFGDAGGAEVDGVVAVGSSAFSSLATGGHYGVGVGYLVGLNLSTGSYDTFLGSYAGLNSTTATRCIYLGSNAGYRQTVADDRLLVDNQRRADIATELTHSILYGTMAANPEDQQLTINVDALTIGTDADADVVMTWQANTNTGVLNWMEDEDYFQFDDDVNIQTLDASAGVYTDANKTLTSTPPTGGALGYWDRTGVVLSPATAGDTLSTDGGRIVNTTRIVVGDSPYTTVNADHVIFADTDGGAITVNLQAGTEGRFLRILNCGSSGNAVTVTPNGAETVWGLANVTLNDGDILIICFNATEYWW